MYTADRCSRIQRSRSSLAVVQNAMKGDAKPIPAAIRATSPTVRLITSLPAPAEQIHVLQFVDPVCPGVKPARRLPARPGTCRAQGLPAEYHQLGRSVDGVAAY